MSNNDIKTTRHSKNRTKERLGISKKLADKNAQKALERGITHSETKGGLSRYLDGLYLSHKAANNIRVYNRNVYLFNGTCLITIITLPQALCGVADKLQKDKENKK